MTSNSQAKILFCKLKQSTLNIKNECQSYGYIISKWKTGYKVKFYTDKSSIDTSEYIEILNKNNKTLFLKNKDSLFIWLNLFILDYVPAITLNELEKIEVNRTYTYITNFKGCSEESGLYFSGYKKDTMIHITKYIDLIGNIFVKAND